MCHTKAVRVAQVAVFILLLNLSGAGGQERSGLPAKDSNDGYPEGRIAFSSVAPRDFDLYVRDLAADASNSTQQPTPVTQHASLDYNAAYSPDDRRIAFVSERDGNMELYTMEVGGADARRLTNDPALDDHPTWSPDGRRLAFVSTRRPAPAGQAWNAIHIIDDDGGNLSCITPPGAADYSPDWSPSGDLIAVASGSGRTGQSDILVMRPDGTERRVVARNGGWPTFIDDGRAIAFHRRDRSWGIWKVNTDGSGLQPLLENASMPRASRNGTHLAVVSHAGAHQQIARLDLQRGVLAPVTSGSTDHWNPAMTSDGSSVIYHKRTPGRATRNVEYWSAPVNTGLQLLRLDGAFPAFAPDYQRLALTGGSFARVDVMRVDGTQRQTIFEADRRSVFAVAWSAKPEEIAFSHGTVFAGAGTSVNIKVASPDGKNEIVELTGDAGNNGFPAYSPDGKRIVFRSGRDGQKNLYLMDRNGEQVRRLTEGDWTDSMCDWSPTNEWIVFASDRDDDFEIWLVRPGGTGLHKLIGGGGRNNHPHFSPDGQWIVFTSQRAGYSAEEVSLPSQPQPYGDLFIVRLDGSGLLRLTHNGFEEGTPDWGAVR